MTGALATVILSTSNASAISSSANVGAVDAQTRKDTPIIREVQIRPMNQTRQSARKKLETTSQSSESSNTKIKSTSQSHESANLDLKPTSQPQESTKQKLKSASRPHESTNQDIKSTTQIHESPKTDFKNAGQASEKTSSQRKAKAVQHRAPIVERYLTAGDFSGGESYMSQYLSNYPHDDQARFGLGMLQFLRAVESLGQDLYRYGMRIDKVREISSPLTRLPIQANPLPEVISYNDVREMIDNFRIGVLKAESTLSEIKSENLKLPIHFGLIKLDLNGDGAHDDDESLWNIYASVTGNHAINSKNASRFLICFDRGDVHWLRGYCHLIAGVTEVYLAHDSHETFEHAAHFFFNKVESPYDFLRWNPDSHAHRRIFTMSERDILDFIAFIHSIDWPVVEPKRMEEALHHFESVVEQSHITWRYILSETDDDHEWLPNPNQTGVIPDVHITYEMIDAWKQIMTESGKLLSGELLIPFWRGKDKVGVNLRRVFLEPSRLDVVYWVQGSAALPYLETGKCTEGDFWRRFTQVFGHNFPGFALYFN